jgi:SWI/SNF-related matrix-associated actin-dependent regulator 1 of chromatin subfamily A
MSTATIKIESLCDWSAPRRVETKKGPRNLRTAEATSEFWDAWRHSKTDLKAAGVGCGKNRNGAWEATWWQPLTDEQQQAMETAIKASRATSVIDKIPCPDGQEYLPFQAAGIKYASERDNCLIGDEMGLGKTIQAIGVINACKDVKRVLVICPASLRLNWQREMIAWLARSMSVGVVKDGKPESWESRSDVVIVNYDVVKKHRAAIDKVDWDLLILDECQYLKNGKAARTKAVYGDSKGQGGIKSARTVALSGTPLVNRPVELFTLLQRIDPEGLGRNFFSFAKKFCDATKVNRGRNWDFSGASNLDMLQRLLRERVMVRREKSQVLTELPAKRRQVVVLPANGAAAKVNAEQKAVKARQDAIVGAIAAIELAKADDKTSYDAAVESLRVMQRAFFSEISKMRHEVAMAKVPYVIKHVEDALESGPVVLFAHHKDVIADFADHFGDRCVTLTGETSMDDRQKAVDRFQAGEVDVFIGNIQAAGVGITLVRSTQVIFAELDWVPGNLSQAEDRCHRIGQAGSVNVQHLVLDGSIDAQMAHTVIAKQQVIDAALDRAIDVDELKKPMLYHEIAIGEACTKKKSRPKIEELAKEITSEQSLAIHEALRTLQSLCDGAQALDGQGFNKLDASIGRSLAEMRGLTHKQAALGQIIARKYRRQLAKELLVRCGIN